LNTDKAVLTRWQQWVLVFLRFAIGWHLFYQGFGKIISPYWTSKGYLMASWGPFARIAESPTLLLLSDYLMIWSLLILGFLLMVGLFTRAAAVAGVFLLLLIFIAVPPLDYTGFVISTNQGSELYVDKTFIEILALVAVASFRTGHMLGLDILFDYWRNK